MTSTSTNEHYDKALAILNTAPRYRLDGPGDPHIPGLAIDTLEHHIREMAAQIEEREAQLRLIAPVVSAALEMFQWEGSTDYPDGDPEVIKRRRAFRDALYHLDDLHYDELDFLDDFQPGDMPDLPNDDGSNGR